MYRILIAFLLLLVIKMVHSHFIPRTHRKDSRSGRLVSVYDRNCFFSPIACHFRKGRISMTFITPREVEEEKRQQRISRHP